MKNNIKLTGIMRYDKKYRDYLQAWQDSGYKLTQYKCPHCKKMIDLAKPEKKHITSKGYWDSLRDCPLCKKIAFVSVYPSGKTETKILKVHD